MMPFELDACRAFCDRRNRARQFANVGEPIPIQRPTPILRYEVSDRDTRPPALSRGPCPRCEIRGEIGCAHQRPFEAGETVPYNSHPVRWDYRRIERGGRL